jgi:hypothetical protein
MDDKGVNALKLPLGMGFAVPGFVIFLSLYSSESFVIPECRG